MSDSPSDASIAPALAFASSSLTWYKRHATLAGREHKVAEVAVIGISAAIPATVAVAPSNTNLVAILGAAVTVIAGLRAVFHWQDDYVHYSLVREALREEMFLYETGSGKYEVLATRDETLIKTVSQIERDDMRNWARLTSRRTALSTDDGGYV